MPTLQVTREIKSHVSGGGFRAAFIRVLIMGVAVFLAVTIVPGLQVDSFGAGVAAVLVLTGINLLIRPLLLVLTFPLIVVSLGLFLIVVNALLLELTAYLVKGFSIAGFWPAVGGALVISLVTMILNLWTADHRRTEGPTLPQRPPKIINPDE
jgi:putative membrane protein